MSRSGARADSRLSRSVQSWPLVLRMLRSELSAAIVARPSGWLTSTFRMAICRDTHNSTPQLETASNVVLLGWTVYGAQGEAQHRETASAGDGAEAVPTGRAIGGKRAPTTQGY